MSRRSPAPPTPPVVDGYLRADHAADLLVAEGFARSDVDAAFDSLVNAGLDSPQPANGWVVTLDEVQVMRDQLGSGEPVETATATYTEEGRILIDGTQTGRHFDADGGEWVAGVDAVLADLGWERTGDWDGDDAPVRATR